MPASQPPLPFIQARGPLQALSVAVAVLVQDAKLRVPRWCLGGPGGWEDPPSSAPCRLAFTLSWPWGHKQRPQGRFHSPHYAFGLDWWLHPMHTQTHSTVCVQMDKDTFIPMAHSPSARTQMVPPNVVKQRPPHPAPSPLQPPTGAIPHEFRAQKSPGLSPHGSRSPVASAFSLLFHVLIHLFLPFGDARKGLLLVRSR